MVGLTLGQCPLVLVVHASRRVGGVVLGSVLLGFLGPPLVITLEGSPLLVVVSTAGVLVSLIEVLEPSEGAPLEPSIWSKWALHWCLILAPSLLLKDVLKELQQPCGIYGPLLIGGVVHI
jgi:hypothetical protein